MKVDLDRRENLDGFQKLVSTLRTFSISISICLDVETPKLTKSVLSVVFGRNFSFKRNWLEGGSPALGFLRWVDPEQPQPTQGPLDAV
jgi:hypothetical protein